MDQSQGFVRRLGDGGYQIGTGFGVGTCMEFGFSVEFGVIRLTQQEYIPVIFRF